ncbi:MAG: hypothetical protein KAY24_15430 [Candidatus Eisenbacteria sp.]|nr:hypothetical protein [Candidatus Eisenbacteria bacterium]
MAAAETYTVGIDGDADRIWRLTAENLREWNREAWQIQIVPMMTSPPEYERVWSDWVRTYTDLL